MTAVLTSLRWMVADSATIVRANLTQIRRVPEKMLDATLMPVMFTLLFAYILGSAIALPGGGNYREFLMPGIFMQSMTLLAVATGTAVASDMSRGLVDRFRSLPMSRPAVLIGRVSSDLLESIVGLVGMIGCALIAGWRPHRGPLPVLAAVGLLVLVGFSMSWVGAFYGMIVRSPDAANGLGMSTLFPLCFLANTFVPSTNLPPVLKAISDWNPVSATVAATRQLFGNPGAVHAHPSWPLAHPIIASLAWAVLIVAVFLPLSAQRYRSTVR